MAPASSPPSTAGHLIDLLFFRTLGVGLLVHETVLTETAQWELVVAGICMFFMPEAVRGRESPLFRILDRWGPQG